MMPEAWWEDLAKGTEMAFTKQKIANDFFLKELKAEESSTYDFIYEGKKHDLKKRGFVDAAWGKQRFGDPWYTKGFFDEPDGKQKYDLAMSKPGFKDPWFTTLQILDPGSAPLSCDPSSPFKLGYDYYVKWEKRKNKDGLIEKILVNTEKLKAEFRKHMPNLKNLFIGEYQEGHEQLGGTPTEDPRRPMIYMIQAHFENGKTSEDIVNLLSRFLAVFFRILAVKSSALKTVMDNRKKFFLAALNTAKKQTYTETSEGIYDLKETGFFDVIVRKDTYNKKSVTALQILNPGSAKFSQAGWSPIKPGYDYYAKCEKHEDDNDLVQNIFVNTEELKTEFRKHMPDLEDLFIEEYHEEHKQLRDTAEEDMIYMITAHFENGITSETIDNLLATFFAAFFTILEDHD